MRPEAIRELLVKRPFQPFRLFVSDGMVYDIGHPESAYVPPGDYLYHARPLRLRGASIAAFGHDLLHPRHAG